MKRFSLQLIAFIFLYTAITSVHASGHLQLGQKYTGKVSLVQSWNDLPIGSLVTTTFKGKEKTLGIVTEKNESSCIVFFAPDINESEQSNIDEDKCSEIGQTFRWNVSLEEISLVSGLALGKKISKRFAELESESFTIGDIVCVETSSGKIAGILKKACDGIYEIQTTNGSDSIIIINDNNPPFSLIKAKRKPRYEISPVIDSEEESMYAPKNTNRRLTSAPGELCYLVNPSQKKKWKKRRLTMASRKK